MQFQLSTTEGALEYPSAWKRFWTLLFFYTGDFTPVSASELYALGKLAPAFRKKNCKILAVSRDTVAVHLAFIESLRRYGAEPPFPLGTANETLPPDTHSVWLLAPGGAEKAAFAYPAEVGVNFTEILRTLCALQTGAPVPANWVPEAPVLLPPPETLPEARHFMDRAERNGGICLDFYLGYRTEPPAAEDPHPF